MSLFHRHHWVEVSRTFNEPSDYVNGMEARGPEAINTMRRLSMGFTVIELRCSDCGDLKHSTVLGRSS